MTRGVARIDDLTDGTCYHPTHNPPLQTKGRIISASGDVNVNSRKIARVDDHVQADCGHISKIITGSPDSGGDSKGVARLDDLVGGEIEGDQNYYKARIITSSPNVSANS